MLALAYGKEWRRCHLTARHKELHTARLKREMTLQFLRGNSQTPKGHAIFVARSTADSHTVLCTYCVVPPMPLSLAKYLPSFLAAQLSPEELQDTTNVPVMPIPPMLEEGSSLDHLHMLADYRDDDLCDLGTINPKDEPARMQAVAQGCQEYGQLYMSHVSSFKQATPLLSPIADDPMPMDDMDAEELLIQTMNDRQRLAELTKLVGVIGYALGGKDTHLLQETQQRMQRIARQMPEKYRTTELIAAATNQQARGSKLAELYIERGYKLLDEEYADIPNIERAIRDLQE